MVLAGAQADGGARGQDIVPVDGHGVIRLRQIANRVVPEDVCLGCEPRRTGGTARARHGAEATAVRGGELDGDGASGEGRLGSGASDGAADRPMRRGPGESLGGRGPRGEKKSSDG